MDKRISDYTEQHFHRENIEVITNTRVKEVKQREVIVQVKGSNEFKSIPCSVAIWATGIKARPLTNQIREIIGLDIQSNRMGLLTDQYLRVKGLHDGSIFALGDCATIEQPKLTDQIQSLFEEVDTEHRGALDLQQFRTLVEKKIDEFPQVFNYFQLVRFDYCFPSSLKYIPRVLKKHLQKLIKKNLVI
jgi:NADPH-dependent 2,4-dienoyl-CoA reductase/sulfur reductase-like enzyme